MYRGHPINTNSTYDELYQLNLSSLVWTQIQTNQTKPPRRFHRSLNATTDKQLVLHGGSERSTWILDITLLTWRQHKIHKDDHRCFHTGTEGVNGTVIIIGDSDLFHDQQLQTHHIIDVKREPKSLQLLAMKIIYDYREMQPWKALPKQLTAQIIFPGSSA